MAKKITATICVFTINAEEYLEALLEGVFAQETDFEFEVLHMDSGSTDRTIEISKQFPKVWLYEFPNSEYGHGKTRQKAAEMAHGEFIVNLTHDAVPAHNRWLAEMIRPFSLNPDVAAVFGKQIPRPDCVPATKRDTIGAFAGFGPDYALTLQQKNELLTHPSELDALGFFSDVNSAVRRSVLVGGIPFQDVNYAEDQVLGRDIIKAGLIKVYTPFGAVVHSHSYPPVKYFRRMYDEMVGLKAATGVSLDTSIAFHIAWSVKATLRDWKFIWRDRDYRRRSKLKYLVQAPVYNFGRRIAIRLAKKDELPAWAHNLFSLELNARKKAR